MAREGRWMLDRSVFPNQPLQRTAPGVTLAASGLRLSPTMQPARRPPQSLSLGSLAVSCAPFMKSAFFLSIIAFSLSGCVSAWIVNTGKEPVYAKTRSEAVQAYGAPVLTRRVSEGDPVSALLKSRDPAVRSYEIYEYRGLMKDREFGGAAATANAMTLGISEVFSIPGALANRASGMNKRHFFAAGYDRGGRLISFQHLNPSGL